MPPRDRGMLGSTHMLGTSLAADAGPGEQGPVHRDRLSPAGSCGLLSGAVVCDRATHNVEMHPGHCKVPQVQPASASGSAEG